MRLGQPEVKVTQQETICVGRASGIRCEPGLERIKSLTKRREVLD
jgi:hypothetical protein